MMDSRRILARVAAAIVLIGVVVGGALLVAGPPAVRAAASGTNLPILTAKLQGSDPARIDRVVYRVLKLGSLIASMSIVFGGALYFLSREWYFKKFVKEATPGTLGAIRMLAAGVLLWNTLWEHLPSLSYLPSDLRVPMGFMSIFYKLPIHFDAFLRNFWAMGFFQTLTATFLLASFVGWRSRFSVPMAAFCWFVQGGIIRQYAWFTHQGIVAFYVLTAMSFFPCGDGFSLDRLVRMARGKPVLPKDMTAAVYGWGRYAAWVIFAMCYLAAGLSKLRNGGWLWWHPDNLRGVVLHDALSPMHFSWPFGLWFQNAPDWFFGMLGLGAQYGEILGILVLFSFFWRHIYAAFVVMLHMGIWLLQNVLFFDMMFMQFMLIDFGAGRKKLGAWLNRRNGKAAILYDGWCPLCRRTQRVMSSLDLFDRFEWVDLRKSGAIEQFNVKHGTDVTQARAEHEMVLAYRGKICGGYDAYRVMTLLVPGLWWMAPMMVLPGISHIGRAVYAKVAASRLNLLKCDENCTLDDMEPPPLPARPTRGVLYPVGIAMLLTLLAGVWASGFEVYPFTGVQMYSGRHEGSVVIYVKVLAHYEDGKVERAHLERAIRGLADTRYRRAVELCFFDDAKKQKTAEKFLQVCIERLNRNPKPGRRVTAIEVQRWKWNFRTQANDPKYGEMTSSFSVRPGEKAPTIVGVGTPIPEEP